MTDNNTKVQAPISYWDDEDEILSPESFAVHPGQFLKRNVLNDRNVTISALADCIGVARPGLNNVINGKRALTAEMAILIGKALDYPADVLIRMMGTYELASAHRNRALVERIAAMATFTSRILGTTGSKPANENQRIRKTV